MDQSEIQKPIDDRIVLEWMELRYAALGRAIAEMRVYMGQSGPSISEGYNVGQGPSGVLSPSDVPAGAFHGKSIPKAAVIYLQMVKQKQKTADIAAALKKGGIDSQAAPEKFNGQVHSILDRAAKITGANLVKLPDAYWALREWYPPNVRASMGAGAAVNSKKDKKGKGKRKGNKRAAARSQAAEPGTAAPAPESNEQYRSPKPDSTEGKIIATMRKNSARLWTPKEVAEEAGITRVQTAIFLMGKLAHRGFLEKRDDGLYGFGHA